MQQFSFNPVEIFSLKDTLKIYKGKKKSAKSTSLTIESPLCLRVNDTLNCVVFNVKKNIWGSSDKYKNKN